ncbi:hypothetical protein BD779DRAFT_1474207 [Infundibulicybe gibba]|nr:hypothetical protein BD779DRAFT_1474207 [Infundibulicybe gibba]
MDVLSFQIALALALFFSLPGRAQDNLCMISCTESALSGSGCLLSDISCLCTSAQFKDSYDQCTISNCSFENAQIAQESHAQQCDVMISLQMKISTTSVQPSTGVTNSASTTPNVPQSSNIFTGSSISSASATPSSLPPPEYHKIPVGTILGSVISTIVLVAIILIFWFRYRRRRHDLRAEEPIARVGVVLSEGL